MTAPTEQHPKAPTGRQTGIALVAVLWITALLALLAATIGSTSRTDMRLALNAVEQARAKAHADGGAHQALFELSTNLQGLAWQDELESYQYGFDNGGATVLIRDEDGKLDINEISLDIWRGLLLAIGLDEGVASMLADQINAFRHPDDQTDEGAERARGRSFLTVSELLDVPSMTSEVYQRLEPHITVHAETEGIDPTRASRIALEALPGITPDLALALLSSAPESNALLAIPSDLVADIEGYLLPSRELYFSIESLGVSDLGGRFLRKVIVTPDRDGRLLPFAIHTWRRGYASSLEQ